VRNVCFGWAFGSVGWSGHPSEQFKYAAAGPPAVVTHFSQHASGPASTAVVPPLGVAAPLPLGAPLVPVLALEPLEPLEPFVLVAAPAPVPVSTVDEPELHPIEIARLVTAMERQVIAVVFIRWLLGCCVATSNVTRRNAHLVPRLQTADLAGRRGVAGSRTGRGVRPLVSH
jgi:hypothetical protein